MRSIEPLGWLVTVTVAVEELFPGTESNVAAVTLAGFALGPLSNGAVMILIVARAAFGMVSKHQ